MTVKLCKDCKFYEPDSKYSTWDRCVHPLNFVEPKHDLVRGETVERQSLHFNCASARIDFGLPENSCGQEARWFEEKGTVA